MIVNSTQISLSLCWKALNKAIINRVLSCSAHSPDSLHFWGKSLHVPIVFWWPTFCLVRTVLLTVSVSQHCLIQTLHRGVCQSIFCTSSICVSESTDLCSLAGFMHPYLLVVFFCAFSSNLPRGAFLSLRCHFFSCLLYICTSWLAIWDGLKHFNHT